MFVIAVDGRAASGKTTLAVSLASKFGASIIHMDDFFLPKELRTEERLAQAGGNVHYERFIEEVLPYLRGSVPFSYRIFDCAASDYNGMREVAPAQIRVVEGAYSHHPIFGEYMDMRVFSDVAPDVQLRRIEKRNGKEAAKIFAEKWIVLEEKYFEYYEIIRKAEIILTP